MTYEYMIYDMRNFSGIKAKEPYQAQMLKELNRLGAEGWKLIEMEVPACALFVRQTAYK